MLPLVAFALLSTPLGFTPDYYSLTEVADALNRAGVPMRLARSLERRAAVIALRPRPAEETAKVLCDALDLQLRPEPGGAFVLEPRTEVADRERAWLGQYVAQLNRDLREELRFMASTVPYSSDEERLAVERTLPPLSPKVTGREWRAIWRHLLRSSQTGLERVATEFLSILRPLGIKDLGAREIVFGPQWTREEQTSPTASVPERMLQLRAHLLNPLTFRGCYVTLSRTTVEGSIRYGSPMSIPIGLGAPFDYSDTPGWERTRARVAFGAPRRGAGWPGLGSKAQAWSDRLKAETERAIVRSELAQPLTGKPRCVAEAALMFARERKGDIVMEALPISDESTYLSGLVSLSTLLKDRDSFAAEWTSVGTLVIRNRFAFLDRGFGWDAAGGLTILRATEGERPARDVEVMKAFPTAWKDPSHDPVSFYALITDWSPTRATHAFAWQSIPSADRDRVVRSANGEVGLRVALPMATQRHLAQIAPKGSATPSRMRVRVIERRESEVWLSLVFESEEAIHMFDGNVLLRTAVGQ